MKLSLEQEFNIRCFADKVQHMSHEQAQEFLLVLYEQMMIREKTFQELLKQEWRLDLGTVSG
jgi:hypothetical protein